MVWFESTPRKCEIDGCAGNVKFKITRFDVFDQAEELWVCGAHLHEHDKLRDTDKEIRTEKV
jgi:hypothetical protein